MRKPLVSVAHRICFAAAVAIAASSCRRDTFRPIYYADRANLKVYTRGPSFDNVAQARQWAEDQHRQRHDREWTYDIGKNCRPFENTDVEVCEETLK